MPESELHPGPTGKSGGQQSVKSDACRMSSVFLLGAGQTTLLISLPAIMEETGIGYGLLSTMVALGTGLFIVSAPAWGKASDLYGRKPVVLAGAVGIAFSFFLIALALYGLGSGLMNREQAVGGMFIARIIYGLLASGLYPAVQAWAIDDGGPTNRGRNLSRITASINAGRLLGPLIPALLIDLGSLFPIAFLALLAALLTGLVSMLPSTRVEGQKSFAISRGSRHFRQLLASTWQLLLLACSVTTLFGFLQYMTGPKLQQIFHDGVTTSKLLSLLMMLAALSTIIAHLLVSRWVQGRLVSALKTGSVLLLVGSLLMVTGNSLFWLAAGLIISAFSVALLTPAYTTLASGQADGQQGVLTGTLSMIHTIGYTLGALLAGLIGNLNGWQLEFIGILVAIISLMITFLWIDLETGKSLCLRSK